MTLTMGELFAGYGGLSLALESTLGAELVWYADNDPAAATTMAHHWPGIPNLGDVREIDWPDVPRVDVLAGGFPCQDVSHAGRLDGLTFETRTGLWSHMAYAIAALRPTLVVAENVKGLLHAPADSDVEPCPWCVGDGLPSPMRALGAVLGDLADLGYDAWWGCLRASDVGAAHHRLRIFLYAWPAGTDPHRAGRIQHRGPVTVRPAGVAVERDRDDSLTVLPTPVVNDMGDNKTIEWWDAWAPTVRRKGGGLAGKHGDSLAIETQRLWRTPTRSLGINGGGQDPEFRRAGGHAPTLADEAEHTPPGWGPYAEAVARHTDLAGRPPPPPTHVGRDGGHRLNPAFVEWLMCLPAGHVTDPAMGLTRRAQLRVLGNGVVPPQAVAAIAWFMTEAGAWPNG